MAEHKKHADLARPALGFFGRNEWAILGTTCGNIKQLAFRLTQALAPAWKVAYVDADHKSADPEQTSGRNENTALANKASMEYTDKITFHRFDLESGLNTFQYRPFFGNMDAVLVNGNHFTAKSQVVVIDPSKEDSLKRKLDRLTDVQMILTTEQGQEVPSFLRNHLPGTGTVPVMELSDFQRISLFFQNKLRASVPPLYGLVLAGGHSQRMGTDKGLLNYHGKPQREFLLDLLGNICQRTYLSCRQDQAQELSARFPVLADSFLDLGPLGAILSACRAQPDAAWLVVACDLPLLGKEALAYLSENRNPSAIATAFRSPVSNFPEPLAAIWEPKSYPVLLQFLAQGYSCPRKALINSPVSVIEAPEPSWLSNVNTPEEHRELLSSIQVKP
jgi:molybdopterin-guanine dinucleotide biosynthesis protein A